MTHKILSQGVLDGECFIYSIMNAYKTLICPDISAIQFMISEPKDKSGRSKWEYIIRTCPQAIDMLVGKGFTEYITGIPTNYIEKIIDNQYKNTLITAFDILSGTESEFSVDRISIEEINKFNFEKSVIILPIVKKIKTIRGNDISNHFICINGRNGNEFNIMCSYSIHKLESEKYIESFDDKYSRYYNNKIDIKYVNSEVIGKGINSIFKISNSR